MFHNQDAIYSNAYAEWPRSPLCGTLVAEDEHRMIWHG